MPKQTVTKNTLSRQNKLPARAFGEKLGFLLAALPISTEEKEAWLEVLPRMAPEQLVRFADLLEARFLDAATSEIDAAWLGKLRDIAAQREQRNRTNITKTVKAIEELTRKLESRQAAV